jgi:peptide/nickel transport system permease protein
MAQQPVAFIGMIIVIAFILLALIGPLVAPYDFDDVIRGEDRRALKRLPPSADFIMGTDLVGRDVFSRVLYGARETIGLPLIATALAVFLGTVVGLATGYVGGWFDEIISRALDSLLAIPSLVLALVMLTTIVPMLNELDNPIVDTLGANEISLTIVIVLLYTPIVTRVIRSAALNIRSSGYVEAAKLRGESALFIMFREILPGVLPALAVEASLRLSYSIFLVASLGFLGLGVQPPSPEWGRMVLDARTEIALAPWSLWFPVAAIAILIISVNLMSDGLRRILRYNN